MQVGLEPVRNHKGDFARYTGGNNQRRRIPETVVQYSKSGTPHQDGKIPQGQLPLANVEAAILPGMADFNTGLKNGGTTGLVFLNGWMKKIPGNRTRTGIGRQIGAMADPVFPVECKGPVPAPQ